MDKKVQFIDFSQIHSNWYDKCKKDQSMILLDTDESRKYRSRRIPNEGDMILENIIHTCTNMDNFSLYPYQQDFIKTCLVPLFKFIYRGEWNKNRKQILQRNNVIGVYSEVLFKSPRRMGKTITLAIFCIAVASNINKDPTRPYHIAVFATTQDASKRFIDECEIYWNLIDKRHEFKFDRRAYMIIITNLKDQNDQRFIIAYCGSGAVS